MVCAWRNFQKILVAYLHMISETLIKPQISSIFHFDRASDGRMAHVLGVKKLLFAIFYIFSIFQVRDPHLRGRCSPPK